MIYWQKGIPINLTSISDPGENETTTEIKWFLDETIIPTTPVQEQITIDTTPLSTGEHKIGITAKNSCGNTSDEYSKIFYITEETMIKEIQVTVNQPVVNMTVVMDYTGTINVTVTDPLNTPVQGATVEIVALSMSATTDATGKATLPNVPYSTQTVKVTVP